jgi:hypothetical protein
METPAEEPGDPALRVPPPSQEGAQSSEQPPDPPPGLGYVWYAYPAVRAVAVVLSIAIVALLAWLLYFRPHEDPGVAQAGAGPVETSQTDLAALSRRLGEPVFWAGQREGVRLEGTLTTNEYAYVRYLSGNAPIGDSSPEFLTVATYPTVNALTNLRSFANHEHASTTRISGGGLAVPVPGSPTSVFFARPGEDFQVEVFDRDPGRALQLIKSGEIVPVPGGVQPPR